MGAGFINAGNSCYVAATLQALLHIPSLLKLLDDKFNSHFQKCADSKRSVKECLTCALRLVAIKHARNVAFLPSEILQKLSFLKSTFSATRQEDAHEFLISLLGRLDDENDTGGTSAISKIFSCRINTTVVCCWCDKRTSSHSFPICLSVDIQSISTIQQAVDGARAPCTCYCRCPCSEDESNFLRQFDEDTQMYNVQKYLFDDFSSIPDFLIIQFKRFTEDGQKESKSITISEEIDINGHPYVFVAAILHAGDSAQCGHYTSVIRNRDAWISYNDHLAKVVDSSILTEEVFCSQCYVIFFMKKENGVVELDQVPSDMNEESNVENAPNENNTVPQKLCGDAMDSTTIIKIPVISVQPKKIHTWGNVKHTDPASKVTTLPLNLKSLTKAKKGVLQNWLKGKGLDTKGSVKELISRIKLFFNVSDTDKSHLTKKQSSTVSSKTKLRIDMDVSEVLDGGSLNDHSCQCEGSCEELVALEEQSVVVDLSPEDIPGAILPSNLFNKITVETMKRWLRIRGIPLGGNKLELWERIQDSLRMGKGTYVDPHFEGGRWYLRKQEEARAKVVGMSVRERHPLPNTGWTKFPKCTIPIHFNDGMVLNYMVERHPQGKQNTAEGQSKNCILNFHTSKPKKRGHTYIKSDYLENLEDCIYNGIFFLKCDIKASFRTDRHPVSVAISCASGFILYGNCDCLGSSLSRCSHIAALLYFLSQYLKDFGPEAAACTSISRQWGLGSNDKNPSMIRYKDYSSRGSIERKAQYDPRAVGDQFQLPSIESAQEFVMSIPSILKLNWHGLIKIPESAVVLEETIGNLLPESEDSLISDCTEDTLEKKCTNFIESLKCATQSETGCAYLVPGTEEQGGSKWKAERCFRITASMCKAVLGLRSSEAKRKFLARHMWGLNSFTNAAIEWGRNHEVHAFQWYLAVLSSIDSKCFVTRTGLWVSCEFPQLGCSPDGIATLGDGEKILLEIKCPYILREHSAHDFWKVLSKKQIQRFHLIRELDGTLIFNEAHSYYYQIQMSMGILGYARCHFVTWTPINALCVEIKFDESFWLSKRNGLLPIYQMLFVPEWILQNAKNGLAPLELIY